MNGRAGSVLGLVLVVLAVIGGLGLSLGSRALRARYGAYWSRDHLIARTLAESAAEELYVRLQRDGAGLARALGGAALVCPPLTEVEAAKQAMAAGCRVDVTTGASVRRIEGGTALVALEAGVKLTRPGRPPVTERVLVERSLRAADTALGLGRVGLIVVKTTDRDLKNCRGKGAVARVANGAKPLYELMTKKSKQGFRKLDAKGEARLAAALRALAPAAMLSKAHALVGSRAELLRLQLAASRTADGALSGIIHVANLDPVPLAFPRFRGRCLLSFTGPVVVRDIKLDDPALDTLTIVAPTILVRGGSVEANLVATAEGEGQLMIGQPATFRGTVITDRFPRAVGMDGRALGECRFEAPAATPDGLVAALSPYPVAVQRAQEAPKWLAW